MSVVLLALIGVAAGFIASKLMRTDLSLLETVAIGLLGAVLGGAVLRAVIAVSSLAFGLIGAVVGACILIWLYQRYLKR